MWFVFSLQPGGVDPLGFKYKSVQAVHKAVLEASASHTVLEHPLDPGNQIVL